MIPSRKHLLRSQGCSKLLIRGISQPQVSLLYRPLSGLNNSTIQSSNSNKFLRSSKSKKISLFLDRKDQINANSVINYNKTIQSTDDLQTIIEKLEKPYNGLKRDEINEYKSMFFLMFYDVMKRLVDENSNRSNLKLINLILYFYPNSESVLKELGIFKHVLELNKKILGNDSNSNQVRGNSSLIQNKSVHPVLLPKLYTLIYRELNLSSTESLGLINKFAKSKYIKREIKFGNLADINDTIKVLLYFESKRNNQSGWDSVLRSFKRNNITYSNTRSILPALERLFKSESFNNLTNELKIEYAIKSLNGIKIARNESFTNELLTDLYKLGGNNFIDLLILFIIKGLKFNLIADDNFFNYFETRLNYGTDFEKYILLKGSLPNNNEHPIILHRKLIKSQAIALSNNYSIEMIDSLFRFSCLRNFELLSIDYNSMMNEKYTNLKTNNELILKIFYGKIEEIDENSNISQTNKFINGLNLVDHNLHLVYVGLLNLLMSKKVKPEVIIDFIELYSPEQFKIFQYFKLKTTNEPNNNNNDELETNNKTILLNVDVNLKIIETFNYLVTNSPGLINDDHKLLDIFRNSTIALIKMKKTNELNNLLETFINFKKNDEFTISLNNIIVSLSTELSIGRLNRLISTIIDNFSINQLYPIYTNSYKFNNILDKLDDSNYIKLINNLLINDLTNESFSIYLSLIKTYPNFIKSNKGSNIVKTFKLLGWLSRSNNKLKSNNNKSSPPQPTSNSPKSIKTRVDNYNVRLFDYDKLT